MAGSANEAITYLSGMLENDQYVCRYFIYLSPIDTEIQALIDGWSNIKLFYYKCTSLIVPSRFSTNDLKLQKRSAYCTAMDVLHIDKSLFKEKMAHSSPENACVEALLRGIKGNTCLNALEVGFHLEKDAFLHIIDIWKIFCKEIILSRKNYANSDLENFDTDKIKVNHLGMGVAETWRGVPDSRIRGFSLNSEVPLLSSKKYANPDSNGTSTICEAKLKIDKEQHFAQLVKTVVVSAFIEHNLHPDLNTTIPAILVDDKQAVVALYCVKEDLLLLSEVFCWRKGRFFNLPEISFIWAIINHRYI